MLMKPGQEMWRHDGLGARDIELSKESIYACGELRVFVRVRQGSRFSRDVGGHFLFCFSRKDSEWVIEKNETRSVRRKDDDEC